MRLIKFRCDYADEFDVYGLTVLSESHYKFFKKCLDAEIYPVSFYFGTNEELVFESKKEILRSLETDKISDEENDLLDKLDLTSFGVTKLFERVVDNYLELHPEERMEDWWIFHYFETYVYIQ